MKGKENNRRRRSATKQVKVEIRRSEASNTTTSQKLRREISKKRIKMKLAMKREGNLQVGEGPSMEHNVPTTLNLFPDPLELTIAPPPQPVELSKGKEIATTSKDEKRGNEVEAVGKKKKKKIKNMGGGEGDQCDLSLKL